MIFSRRILMNGLWLLIFIPFLELSGAELLIPGNNGAQTGVGYNLHSERITPGCLNVRLRETGAFSSTIIINRPASIEELHKLLGSGQATTGHISFRTLAGKGLSAWLFPYKETATTVSLHYLVRTGGYWETAGNVELSSLGQSLSNGPPDRILASCGSHFISRTEYGGYLIVVINFRFSTEALAQRFKTDMNLNLTGIEEIHNKIGFALREFRDRVHINISARQAGGDVRKLHEILRNDSFLCSQENHNACKELGKNLVDYIIRPGGFRDQIGAGNRDHLLPLQQYIRPYSDIPALEGVSVSLSGDAARAKKNILETLTRQTEDEVRIKHKIKISGSGPSPSEIQTRESIRANTGILRAAALRCREEMQECTTQLSLAKSRLRAYDPGITYSVPGFLDYCLAGPSPDPGWTTLQALRSAPGTGGTDCFDDFHVLQSHSFLNLSGMGIKDLNPLRGLTGLKKLDLSHNKIADTRALSFLPDLQELDLSYALEPRQVTPVLPAGIQRLGLWGNELDSDEILRKYPDIPEILVTLTSACERELKWLVDQSMLTWDLYQTYSEAQFGPYWTRYRVSFSGFFLCPLVAWQYRLIPEHESVNSFSENRR